MGLRRWTEEMDAVIARRTAVDTYQSRIVAQDIVTELEADDPELLYEWLKIRAADLIREVINHRDRSRRASGIIEQKKQDFKDAMDEFVTGRSEAPIRTYLGTMYAVNWDNDRKQLRNMTKRDLEFVADRYQDRAEANGLLSAYHRTLARKVGDRTVGEVFTEAQLAAMRATITGSD